MNGMEVKGFEDDAADPRREILLTAASETTRYTHNAVYVWEPLRGGQALIVGEDGSAERLGDN